MGSAMFPSAQLAKVPALSATTELYRSCMNLSVEARALLVQNEGMKRLGLNAQVLATQTGEHGVALEVIVSEIGRLSSEIRAVLGELGNAADRLSHFSIEVLRVSHLNASYKLGLARGIEARSAGTYEEACSGNRSRGKAFRKDLKKSLRVVSGLLQDLGRISHNLPSVTTMIRIVVSEVETKAVEMLGTVDDLNSFREHLDSKVEHMERIHAICAQYLWDLNKEDP